MKCGLGSIGRSRCGYRDRIRGMRWCIFRGRSRSIALVEVSWVDRRTRPFERGSVSKNLGRFVLKRSIRMASMENYCSYLC